MNFVFSCTPLSAHDDVLEPSTASAAPQPDTLQFGLPSVRSDTNFPAINCSYQNA